MHFMEVYRSGISTENWFITCLIVFVAHAIALIFVGRKLYKDAKKLTGVSL